MGMMNSDDEDEIMRNQALQDWARQRPERSWDYDRTPTEDEREDHTRAVRDWYNRYPDNGGKVPYDDGRG